MEARGVIGLDLGGTQIKALLVDRQGEARASATLDTEAARGPEHVIEQLARAAQVVCTSAGVPLSEVRGIGVGTPGPLRMSSGVVLRSANLPGWDHVPLRDLLARRTGREVALINDASAACFGEYWRGAGRGTRHLVMLTLGTGVGGGAVVDGELLIGHFDNASEFGHLIVYPGGRHCGCGQRGCLEAYAGGLHLVEQAEARGVFRDGEARDVPALLAAVERGCAEARDLWSECCTALAIACVNLQHALNPELILLGGGISSAGQRVLEPVRSARESLLWTLADDAPRIELAALGNAAGAMGAAGWFVHTHEHERL